jgi:NitT/TauT family transport system substrate-binding protein
MATIWVAQDIGLFEKHGLRVNLSSIPNGQQGMAALLAGEVDLLQIDGFPSTSAALQGADSVVVATTHRRLIMALFSRPEFSSPEELKGQAIAVTGLGTPGDLAARIALESLGLAPVRDVVLAPVGSAADILPAVESGRVAAGVGGYPATEMARQRGFREWVDIGELAANVAFAGITTTRRFAEAHPEVVRDYSAAEIEAAAYILANKQQTTAVIGKYLQLTDPSVLSVTYDMFFGKYLNRTLLPSADSFVRIVSVLRDLAPEARSFDPAAMVDDRFVRQLIASGYVDRVYREYGQEPP